MANHNPTFLAFLLTLLLSALALPVVATDAVVEARGYDGDWLYSRQPVDVVVKETEKRDAEMGKREVVVDAQGRRRGYDGDWLYSKREAEAVVVVVEVDERK